MAVDTTTIDEESLINALLRVRASGATTAAACFTELQAEFGEALTLSAVKKASNKAAKRFGGLPTAEASEKAAPLQEVKQPKQSEAKQAKEAKKAATELKQAENAMMDAQRRLRAAKSGGDQTAMAVQVTGTIEEFIQKITMVAMAGILEEGEERFLKERVEADIAALEWVKLAQKSGALSLTEDVVALGGELQLVRLKEVRGARDVAATLACYSTEKKKTDGSYTNVDKLVSRSGALAVTPAVQDGELDDID